MVKKETLNTVSLVAMTQPNSKVAEQFRMVRTNIKFAMMDKRLKTLLSTSTSPSEGKSTVTINLALVMAGEGEKVLLVDADLRKPQVASAFQLPNNQGLSTLIADSTLEIEDVIQHVNKVKLDIITSGPIPPNPSELLGSHRMNDILKKLEEKYDFILFDMPPILSVTDAQVMSTKVDGVIVVIRRNVAYTADVLKAKEQLELVNANVIGVVFNGEENTTHGSSYYMHVEE